MHGRTSWCRAPACPSLPRMDVELRQITSETVRAPCELGVTAASTSVVPSNTAATRLYESLGFRLTGEEDDGELMMVLDM